MRQRRLTRRSGWTGIGLGEGAMSPIGQSDHDDERVLGVRVTVLAVDDQDYFRAVMREVVQATEGFQWVGEAASGEAALEAAEALSPSLVLIDKRMPGMGGVEACRRLTERHPELVVVITSIEDPDATVVESCRAAAFVRKQDLSPRFLREVWRQQRAERCA